MKSLNLCGGAIFGIAISNVLSITDQPESQEQSVVVAMERDVEQIACLRNVRFLEPKSRTVIGELLNVYREE